MHKLLKRMTPNACIQPCITFCTKLIDRHDAKKQICWRTITSHQLTSALRYKTQSTAAVPPIPANRMPCMTALTPCVTSLRLFIETECPRHRTFPLHLLRCRFANFRTRGPLLSSESPSGLFSIPELGLRVHGKRYE